MLLTRVPVLAVNRVATTGVDGDAEEENRTSAIESGDDFLVTLALTQREAERTILAQQVGELYLGLLSDSSVSKPGSGVINRAFLDPDALYQD